MKSLEFSRRIVLPFGKRTKHWNSSDQQYWQRSKIATLHFQPSLPRLPIPELNKTCERYLLALKPLLDDSSFNKTQAYVEEFKSSTGSTLQRILQESDAKNKHTSYISKYWYDMYLKDRTPLPLNMNPVLVLVNDKRPEYNTQLIRTANLIISSLRFYRSLKDGVLEPEVFHLNSKKSDTSLFRFLSSKVPSSYSWYVAYMFNAYPLDMSQYHCLFNSTRIPKFDKDVISSNYNARHISVQYKGNFYIFDVLDENGYILTPETILSNLKVILESDTESNNFPLGILTTLNRNDWSNLHSHLEELGNQQSLNFIDSALFNVCLDDSIVGEDPEMLCRNFLHGDGKNRWFDKSFSLIISKEGVAGINFEHSWGDGVAVLRYCLDVYADSTNNSTVHPLTQLNSGATSVRKIEFNLDDKLKSSISTAIKDYKNICDSMDLNTVVFDRLGKKFCKNSQVSPDAIMQLGFQVAYHKMTGSFASTYESCSTAAFKHGRTETVRPCTTATQAFALAVNSKNSPSNSELQHLISECSRIHGQLTKDAAMGQGFDRHLFALRILADAENIQKPIIFADSAYQKINHNILSTSTLSSPIIWIGGFGPVVKNGYGIGYSMSDDSLGAIITSYKTQANGRDFSEALKESYKDIFRVLEGSSKN